jgi:hypothetical protein
VGTISPPLNPAATVIAVNMIFSKNYLKKVLENNLPVLQEDERIYFNVPYKARGFAKISNCAFDGERKLWYTGIENTFLRQLIDLYGINKETSSKAMLLIEKKLIVLNQKENK